MSSSKTNVRWFWICSLGTITVVVGGWLYFFVGQVHSLSSAVPATADSASFLADTARMLGEVGSQTIKEAKAGLGADAAEVLSVVQQAAARTALAEKILAEMQLKIAAYEEEQPTESEL